MLSSSFVCIMGGVYCTWNRLFSKYLDRVDGTNIYLLLLRIFVQKEEIYLEKVFGSEYFNYNKKVPCILPYGWLKTSV